MAAVIAELRLKKTNIWITLSVITMIILGYFICSVIEHRLLVLIISYITSLIVLFVWYNIIYYRMRMTELHIIIIDDR